MKIRQALYGLAAMASFMAAGCGDTLNANYITPDKMDKGIVYILPGIQGVDYHYTNIRRGLTDSGVQCAIKIHPWGCQIPGINLAINETSTVGDRDWGGKIAEEIQAYQQDYPGRPVYIIGQSGGCGVAVFTAEALAGSGGVPMDGLILLDASLSADYDLTTALGMCRKGIVNFYNDKDVALLAVGTAMFGNVDGGHGDSAGRTGFESDFARLYEFQVTPGMVNVLDNPHFADTSSAFTSQYIAPWIAAQSWPVAFGDAD